MKTSVAKCFGNWVSTSLGNSGLCWSVFACNKDIAVPAKGNGDLQTLICVLVARPWRCSTLSNPVPWQNWMAAYLGYTLRMKTLLRGWPVMIHDTHTRRRKEERQYFTGRITTKQCHSECQDLQSIIIWLKYNLCSQRLQSKVFCMREIN